jgi:hypothetical protein
VDIAGLVVVVVWVLWMVFAVAAVVVDNNMVWMMSMDYESEY